MCVLTWHLDFLVQQFPLYRLGTDVPGIYALSNSRPMLLQVNKYITEKSKLERESWEGVSCTFSEKAVRRPRSSVPAGIDAQCLETGPRGGGGSNLYLHQSWINELFSLHRCPAVAQMPDWRCNLKWLLKVSARQAMGDRQFQTL